MTLHVPTPIWQSTAFSQASGLEVFLKIEAIQPCGSFKLRGVGHACEVHHAAGARHFVSSSGGNAGYAVAYAGRRLGVPVTVVVPESTTERAKTLIAMEDAKVIVHGSNWMEANAHAQRLIGPESFFIHPFDDPLLWTGHATMMSEAAQQMPKPDVVVCSVGGGGLLAGVAQGLLEVGWNDVGILATETAGAASYAAALAAGSPVLLDAIQTIATSLGARAVCTQSVRAATQLTIRSCVLTDQDAVRGCAALLNHHRLLTEPACGVSMAALDAVATHFPQAKRVLAIVCGGVGTTPDQLRNWEQSFQL